MKTNSFFKKGIVFCLELYFIINFFYLTWYVLDLAVDKSTEIITFLLICQNIMFAFVVAAIYVYGQKKNKNQVPYSLVISSDEGKIVKKVPLYQEQSFFIIKKGNELFVEYSDKKEAEIYIFAVLNFISGDWYLESFSAKYPIGLKKIQDSVIYKLKTTMPYKLSYGDLIYIDNKKIRIEKMENTEG